MNEKIRQFCEAHKNEMKDYAITEIPTDNGTGYLISYGVATKSDVNNARIAGMIISDEATLDGLNAVVSLKPASGGNNGDPNTSNVSVVTYHELYQAVESGDFSMIPSNAIVSLPGKNTADWYYDVDLACDLIEDNGGTIKNIGEMGFSMSGGSAVDSAAKSIISGKYPDATYRVVNCDAVYQEIFISGTHQKEYTEEQRLSQI